MSSEQLDGLLAAAADLRDKERALREHRGAMRDLEADLQKLETAYEEAVASYRHWLREFAPTEPWT